MTEQEFNKVFSENLNNLLILNDKSQQDLASYMGVSTASVSNWCNGIKLPRMDKVDKICAYFGVRRSSLMEDKSLADHQDYYLNEEVSKTAQEIYEDPDLRILLDATRGLSKDDISMVVGIVKQLKARDSK